MNSTRCDRLTRSRSPREGPIARALERQIGQMSSETFLATALGTMAVSAHLFLIGDKQESRFLGMWVPTLLLFGVYNKIVRVSGTDRATSEPGRAIRAARSKMPANAGA